MEIIDKINKLKKEKNAVVLVHNYQLPEIHDIADFVGDSLGLSIEAANTTADVIVFCGVHFMAETAKILSPQKKVLLPDKNAGCPMADMIDAESLKALKAKHPRAVSLCYVNTSAAVKAECDYCCTSANALKMVQHILAGHEEIIFVPDRYLASFVSAQVQRNFILWNGHCPIHAAILPEHIAGAKKQHPHAKVLIHPECKPDITALADIVTSTEGMCRYVKDSTEKEFIIGTELGIIARMQKENPGKLFYPASGKAICPDMKRTTLAKVLRSLTDMTYEITVPQNIVNKARLAIERMTQVT
ncbi:MAG: Quinolinate synthase A [Smithella sp. PtaU1.Bin162]|nr:MAG: Quinolinate synthase A [Smithella sp. PtaU1.Bin162]